MLGYNFLEVVAIALSILNSIIWPIFIILLLVVSWRAARTGKIGEIDLNTIFQKRYNIHAGDAANVLIGNDVPLDSEGKLDEKEFVKRTSALAQQYHAQGLQQSRISFLFSIAAAVLGFLVIIYGVILALNPYVASSAEVLGPTVDAAASPITKSAITVVSGVIIDAVAALFFVQSNKARVMMTEFFDKLRIDRKLDESLKLISSIEDKEIAGRTQSLLAINLAEIDIDGPVFERVITGEYKPKKEQKPRTPTKLNE